MAHRGPSNPKDLHKLRRLRPGEYVESGNDRNILSSKSLQAAVQVFDRWVDASLLPLKMSIDAYAPHLRAPDLFSCISLGTEIASMKGAARAVSRWDDLDGIKARTRDLVKKLHPAQRHLTAMRIEEHRFLLTQWVEGVLGQFDWVLQQTRQLRRQHEDLRNNMARILDDVRYAESNPQLDRLQFEAQAHSGRLARVCAELDTETMPQPAGAPPRPTNAPAPPHTAGIAGAVAEGLWFTAADIDSPLTYRETMVITDVVARAVWSGVCETAFKHTPSEDEDWASALEPSKKRYSVARAMGSRAFIVLTGVGHSHPRRAVLEVFLKVLGTQSGAPDWKTLSARVSHELRNKMIQRELKMRTVEAQPDPTTEDTEPMNRG